MPAETKYRIEVHDDPQAIDARAWDALLAASAQPTPFMRHAYLAALHASGSAVPATGWHARFVTVHADGALHATAALYLKTHSYGEYVFDWSWADAYRRHGLRYYPKGLIAVPFTPAGGSRLPATDAAARATLLDAIEALAASAGLSSVHALFVDDGEARTLAARGWMLRRGLQFHWSHDDAPTASSLADLLATMQRDKRKKIQQERRKVADAGVTFEVLEGAAITEAHWDFFHRCYTATYHAHGGTPYLTRDFFARMASTMPEHWLLFVARRGGEPIASSLVAIDPQRGHAWGRYWGALDEVSCLHFEACYYQPLAWCLANGYVRFEGGAQGVHKMARGLLPRPTQSAHWVADARWRAAIDEALADEREHIAQAFDELSERSPFKPRAAAGEANAADPAE